MGSSRGFRWNEVELLNDRSGKPRLEFSEGIRARLDARGVRRVHVSVSHTGSCAVAVVVFET